MAIMDSNGEMKAKIEALENACRVFKQRNPNWILTANKQEMRMIITSVLAYLGMLGNEEQDDAD